MTAKRGFIRSALLCASGALAMNACDPPLSITTDPQLLPAWDPSVTDYVVRCRDRPVTVTVQGSADTRVRVDERDAPAGTSTQVTLTSGQAFPIDVTLAD